MHPILTNRQRLSLHLGACAIFGALVGMVVRVVLGARWVESMAFALPIGLLAAPASLSAWYLCRALPVSRTGLFQLTLTSMAAAAITASLWAALGGLWWEALAAAGVTLPVERRRALFVILIGLGALAYLIAITAHYVVQAFEASAAAERRSLELEIAQREAELRALRAQIDPHFLFNSLNSVVGLIGADPERARFMCQLLADFLRDSLALGASGAVPLSREIALAEQYLRIEQVRFGSRLSIDTRMDEGVADAPVPPLMLQPLVENAVRHGIGTLLEGGTISIEGRRVGRHAIIAITNPRDDGRRRAGTGFGLAIVQRRLAVAFGDAASMVARQEPSRYIVSVTLPIEGAG